MPGQNVWIASIFSEANGHAQNHLDFGAANRLRSGNEQRPVLPEKEQPAFKKHKSEQCPSQEQFRKEL
jgi:hypothetical protein